MNQLIFTVGRSDSRDIIVFERVCPTQQLFDFQWMCNPVPPVLKHEYIQQKEYLRASIGFSL
jgi:hypothetical protein